MCRGNVSYTFQTVHPRFFEWGVDIPIHNIVLKFKWFSIYVLYNYYSLSFKHIVSRSIRLGFNVDNVRNVKKMLRFLRLYLNKIKLNL